MRVVIYHNPRCSKSRETLALLRDRGVTPEVIEYLKTPPSADEFLALARKVGLEPHALLRTKEGAYAARGLGPTSSPEAIARAVAEDPILLERPIVVVGKKAALGRPPENVLELLG